MSSGSVLSRLVAGPFVRPGGPEVRREEGVPAAAPLAPAPVARPAVGGASEDEGAGLLRAQRPEAVEPAPTPRAEPVVRPRPPAEEPPVGRAAPVTPHRDTPTVHLARSEAPAAPALRPPPVAQPPVGPGARLAVAPLVVRERPREEERTATRGPLQAAAPVEERPSRLASAPLAPVRVSEIRTQPAPQRSETPQRTETRPEMPLARAQPPVSSARGSVDQGSASRVATPPAPRPAPVAEKPLPPRERPAEPLKAADPEDRIVPRSVVRPSAVEPKEERTSSAPRAGDEATRAQPRVLLPPAVQSPAAKGAPAPVAPMPRGGVEPKRAAQGPQPRPGVPGGGRGRGAAHSPERSAPASSDRSRQAGRPAVSIAIGTLEIRERMSPTAQPLPAVAPRSHEIDPGLGLGGLAPGRW